MALIESLEAALGQLTLIVGLDEAVIAGPPRAGEAIDIPPDPDAIRDHVRFDEQGGYRPLSGLRNLPGGWQARFTSLETFSAAIDAVYPLAQRHAAQFEAGTLQVTSLDEVFARQTGRYRVAADLSARGREAARGLLCGACVRTPVWAVGGGVPPGGIPCPEPCSILLALCREAALWQSDPPCPSPADPDVPFANFEEPGNQLREAYLRATGVAREQ
jgi:sirohydrochlorin cobaltochelatase